jgi:hypothetical protein
VSRRCLELLAAGDPLARGEMAAGLVNSYPANAERCQLQRWPTNAALASSLLANQRDKDTVSRLLVERAVAHPESAENLSPAAVAAGQHQALAKRIAAALRATTDNRRHSALLRLALETSMAQASDVNVLAGIVTGTGPAIRPRAAIAVLRWTDEVPLRDQFLELRKQAVAFVEGALDAKVLGDLARIGPAGRSLLPTLTKRLQQRDRQDVAAVLAVVAAMGSDARPMLPALLGMVREKYPPNEIFRAAAHVGGSSPAMKQALLLAAGRRDQLAYVAAALVEAKVVLSGGEWQRLDKTYDRLCEAPLRKTEREMGVFFTMWNGIEPGCDGVREDLDALGASHYRR